MSTLPSGPSEGHLSHMVEHSRAASAAASPRPDGAALLGKACDVLDAVGASPGGISQAALAAQLGLSRTTLYRILSALVARGLLRQDPSRRGFALGFRLLEMAHGVWADPDLPAAAAPELRQLRDLTGETAYVAALEGRQVLSLARYEGAHPVRSAAQLGQRKPLHCTSQGKSILAFLPENTREALLRGLPMKAFTPHTLTDRRRLATALHIIRTRGFATDDEEIVEGVRCVGAPILNAEGQVLGAVSIAGPAWRLPVKRLELLGPEVAAAGRRIGAQLRPKTLPPATDAMVPVMGSPAAFYGFSPRWVAAPPGAAEGGSLWWGDMLAPELRRTAGDHDAPAARWDTPLRAIVPRVGGGILVLDVAGRLTRCDAAGVAEATDMPAGPLPLRSLRTRPDGSLSAWASALAPDGTTSLVGPLLPNGTVQPVWTLPGEVSALCWSARGDALYAAAPEAGTIHRLEPGRPAPLLLTRLPAGAGQPSGLAADLEGGLWVALRDGWSVARLAADGEIDRVLPLPVPRPTDLCFGGPGLQTLFVCTARHGVGLDTLISAPLSGRLLRVEPGARGFEEPLLDWG